MKIVMIALDLSSDDSYINLTIVYEYKGENRKLYDTVCCPEYEQLQNALRDDIIEIMCTSFNKDKLYEALLSEVERYVECQCEYENEEDGEWIVDEELAAAIMTEFKHVTESFVYAIESIQYGNSNNINEFTLLP